MQYCPLLFQGTRDFGVLHNAGGPNASGAVGEINFVLGKKIVCCASPTCVATTLQYFQEYGSASFVGNESSLHGAS